MRKILVLLFVFLALGLTSVALAGNGNGSNGNGNDCQGKSCEDVPGNECENGEHVGNPHCDTVPDDDGDDDTDTDDGDDDSDDEDLGFLCETDGLYYEDPSECPVNEEDPGDDNDDQDDPGDEGGDEPGDDGDGNPVTPRPRGRFVATSVAAGPGVDQIEFWGFPASPQGVAIMDRYGNWHVIYTSDGEMVIFTVENGKVEFREDRLNPFAENGIEAISTLARIVLGQNNSDTNVEHYRTFDLAYYLATGDLLFTNVWTSLNDEWENQLGIHGTANFNWVNGERHENGVRVK